MKGIPQTKDLNPARPGIEKGFYISMPLFSKLDLSANTNGWTYSDLIHWGTGTKADSLVMDIENFISSLDESGNFIQESAGLTVLEGGFKYGKNFFALSLSEKEFSEMYFHKNLIKLIYYGNFPYVGSAFNSGTFGIGAQHYRELAFNYSRDLNKKLTIGGSAKILFGMGALQTNALRFTAVSPSQGDYINLIATGKANISYPVIFNYAPSGDITTVTDNFDRDDYFKNFSNPGLAVDLGFAYQANKNLELSASLIDLGMIGWKTNTTQFFEQSQFIYSGVRLADPSSTTLPDLQLLIEQLGDSIEDAFRPGHNEDAFSTLLPVKMYMGAEYQLSETASLTGLARIRMYNDLLHTSFTAAANVLIWNGISLTGSYSVMESSFDNLGAGIGFRGGPFQVYAAADNIFSPFHPSRAKNMNLRVGINLIFNDREREANSSNRSSRSKNEFRCP